MGHNGCFWWQCHFFVVGSDQGGNPPSRPAATWSDAQALWQAQHGIAAVHGGSELFLDGTGWSTGSPADSPRSEESWSTSRSTKETPSSSIITIDYRYYSISIGPFLWPHGGFMIFMVNSPCRTCHAAASASNSSHSSGKWSRSWAELAWECLGSKWSLFCPTISQPEKWCLAKNPIVSRKTMVRMNNPTSTCLSLFIRDSSSSNPSSSASSIDMM